MEPFGVQNNQENTKIEKCEKHGFYKYLVFNYGSKSYKSGCPECIQETRTEDLKEAQEFLAKKEKIRDLNARGIEPEYYEATLEKYLPENKSESEALEAAKRIESGELNKLILLGQNGTGKTMLACALAIKLKGIRITMYELSARIRAGYNNPGKSEIEVLDDLLTYGFIAIDEIGRTKGSDAELNWLSYLIDKAHTRGIRLMLISNRQLAKNLPESRRGEAFEYFLPNDTISRLRQDSAIVEVHGRDRRAAFTAV